MRKVLPRVLVPAVFLAASTIAPAAVVEAAQPITVTLGGRAIYVPDETAQFSGRVFNEASGLPVIVGAVDLFVDGVFAGQTKNDLDGRFAFTTVLTGDTTHRLQAVYSNGTILEAGSAEFVVRPGEIDQQQSVIDASVGGLAIGGSSDQQLAQTFIAGRTTTLEQVRAPIACDAGSTLVVEIRDVENDTPGQMVLSRAEFPASGLPSFSPFPPSMRSLWIPQLAITKGQQLAIYLHAVGPCGIFQGPGGDSYAAGSGFYWVNENGEQWLKVTTGHEDLPFQTIVPASDAEPEPAQAENIVEGEIAYVTTGDLADSEQKAACATQTLGASGQGLFGHERLGSPVVKLTRLQDSLDVAARTLAPSKEASDTTLRLSGPRTVVCYRALRFLPGRDFHPLAQHSFQDAPRGQTTTARQRIVVLR